MTRSDYNPPGFSDVPQAQWGSPPAGAVALDAAHLNAMANAIGNSARQVALNVKDYGAKGDGTTDDSAAFAAMATAAKNALRTVPLGLASDPAGTVTLMVPPGDYLITNPGALLGDEGMTAKGVGLQIRGSGKATTNLIFKPAAAGAMVTNDYWQGLQFHDLSVTAGTTGCTFMLSSTTHAAQDYTFTTVRWQGFKYVFDLQGSNNNSEYRFIGCDDSGVETGGAFFHVGTTSTTDQFLNYWFYAHKHQSTSAPFIDAAAGGHFHIFGLDASDWGASLSSPGSLFYLRGASHSLGVCHFEASGVRVEAKSNNAQLLYSEWGQGNVAFRSVDWSSQASGFTYGDIISIVYVNNGGALYTFTDSVLAGGVRVAFGPNDWSAVHRIVFRDCTWLQRLRPSDVVSYGVPGSNGGALPPVDFVGCRGADNANGLYVSPGLVVWDARIGYVGQPLQTPTARAVTVRDADGIGGGPYYVSLPVGALITGLEIITPSAGTWTVTTTEATPTTIGSVTAPTGGAFTDTATTAVFRCDTTSRATLSVTGAGRSGDSSTGLLLIKGYW